MLITGTVTAQITDTSDSAKQAKRIYYDVKPVLTNIQWDTYVDFYATGFMRDSTEYQLQVGMRTKDNPYKTWIKIDADTLQATIYYRGEIDSVLFNGKMYKIKHANGK